MDVRKTELMENGVQAQYPDYGSEFTQIVKSQITPKALREQAERYHDNDIAEAMDTITPAEREKLYRVLDAQTLSGILEYTKETDVYLNELSLAKRVDVLSCMETDKAVEYLKTLKKDQRSTIVELLDEETRKDIALLWSFDEDEVGSIMTTNYIEIKVGLSVREATKSLIDQAAEHDNIATIYVVDEERTFYGAIDLKELIVARENTPLEELIVTSYPYVYA